jgi:hypothetical protein
VDIQEERLNQEWEELLDELRVVLPGAEVLFAFLLTLPFTSRFETIAGTHKTTYFVAFVAAAVATLLLTAPSAQHRLLWRRRAKNTQLKLATWLAIAGTACVAVTVTAVVYLVTNVLYDRHLPAAVAAVCVGMITLFWYAPALVVRARRRGTLPNPTDARQGSDRTPDGEARRTT